MYQNERIVLIIYETLISGNTPQILKWDNFFVYKRDNIEIDAYII